LILEITISVLTIVWLEKKNICKDTTTNWTEMHQPVWSSSIYLKHINYNKLLNHSYFLGNNKY